MGMTESMKMSVKEAIKAPFPWFGGKSRGAHVVWKRFGDVPNYVEPFFGSGAVLFGRPHEPGVETVNDLDGFICNLFRAIQSAPEEVARWADQPVMENDLHARHAWLKPRRAELTARLEGDPDYYDAKIAGWWVWGISCWIGGGWCSANGPWVVESGKLVKKGNGKGVTRQRPHLSDAGQGVNRELLLNEYMQKLCDRLHNVRVCCGDWTRILGQSPTIKVGVTGVFLDPPYSHKERSSTLYGVEEDISKEVAKWALAHGDDPRLLVALCGYDGEHEMPETWTVYKWKAPGGYGNRGRGRGRENAERERIWFSPHCLANERWQKNFF